MTPLAARMYRLANQETKDQLCQSQFFDCQKIIDMATMAAEASKEAGCFEISLNAQLPAERTWLEYLVEGTRRAFLCEDDENDPSLLHVLYLGSLAGISAAPRILSKMTLIRGANIVERDRGPLPEGVDLMVSMILEQLLLIIMQPNLVERVRRRADKRIIRDVERSGKIGDFLHWSECRIRGGVHRKVGDSDGRGAEMPLHYVRKHKKPSLGIWIDGYWRGNADIGIHLKWYSPQPPALVH